MYHKLNTLASHCEAVWYNPRKITPDLLEEGKSIFIDIAEEDLTRYHDLLRLIVSQVLRHLEQRKESDCRTGKVPEVNLILDEWPRICASGNLEKLLDSYKTIRSKRGRIIAIYQSIEAGYQIMGENAMADVLSNNPEEEFIFMYKGRQLSISTFNLRLRKYCGDLGIQPRTSHKIRFCTASVLHKNAMPLPQLQKMLGHTKTSTTLHYLRSVGSDEETLSIMEDCL